MPRSRWLAAVFALAALVRPAEAEAVIVERIVAIVGDKPIFLSELRARGRPFLLQIQQKVPPGPQQNAAESQMFKELIEKMIDEELEAQAAEKARITVTSDEIDNALKNSAAAQGTTVAALYKEARSKGLSDQDFRDEIRRQVLEGKLLLLRVKGRVRITEEDIRSMYERSVRDERRRREYRPAWVVLRLMPGSSPEAIREREALAEQIAERARRGEDFAALAKQYSKDPGSAAVGGDLNFFPKEQMVPQFSAAAFAMKPGDISELVETEFGLHIIKLTEKRDERTVPLAEISDKLGAFLKQKRQQQLMEQYLTGLKTKYRVEVLI